jgi:transcriptional regulator with XRE-family HTH domain
MLETRLKKIRKTLMLHQKEMAKMMKVTLRAYQRYESGEQKPSYEKLVNLLDELKDINPTWLLTGEGPMFVGGSKVVDIKDIPKEQIKEFIEEFWQKANEKERIWFEVQFKRAFPEYADWLQKKQLSQTDQDIKDSQGTLQTNGRPKQRCL